MGGKRTRMDSWGVLLWVNFAMISIMVSHVILGRYVITQLPGGRLAEKYGGKRLYGGGVLITSIFTLLTPLAATISLPLFVIVRVIEGFGEGVTFPVMHALLAQVLLEFYQF